MPIETNKEWNYRLFINDIYWKGYGGYPSLQQTEAEKRAFIRSEFYKGVEMRVEVREGK